MQQSLEHINDDSTLYSLISILVCLVPQFQKGNENPVLKDIEDRQDIYRERILFITNRGSLYRLDKCCETINIILNTDSLKSYYFN